MLTTEQLRARAESLGLDFFIERRAGIWVKEWLNDGCSSATAEEVMMWSILANREAQPVAWTNQRSLNTKCKIVAFTDDMSALDYGVTHGWKDIVELYTAPPAPAVPDEYEILKQAGGVQIAVKDSVTKNHLYGLGWNACRAAMLAAAPEGGN